jgi:hypothetical protein
LQLSWIQSQWNLRGGRRSSVEYHTKNTKNPPLIKKKIIIGAANRKIFKKGSAVNS